MEMPEMDGLGLAKEVKARYPNLPIMMLSSIGDETRSRYPGVVFVGTGEAGQAASFVPGYSKNV